VIRALTGEVGPRTQVTGKPTNRELTANLVELEPAKWPRHNKTEEKKTKDPGSKHRNLRHPPRLVAT
jgi:hypothetical protein